jgi:hypothetical protein
LCRWPPHPKTALLSTPGRGVPASTSPHHVSTVTRRASGVLCAVLGAPEVIGGTRCTWAAPQAAASRSLRGAGPGWVATPGPARGRLLGSCAVSGAGPADCGIESVEPPAGDCCLAASPLAAVLAGFCEHNDQIHWLVGMFAVRAQGRARSEGGDSPRGYMRC